MKTFISILSFVCLMAGISQVNAQSPNSNEGRAIAAFRQNCDYNGPVNTESTVTGICFVSGFISEVLITRQVNCNQVDCDAIRLAPLARVHFDCDNNVSYVECLIVN
jgi:hypothetical protein